MLAAISQAKTYALSRDANLGTCQASVEYTYAQTGWRDQLISYNGELIIYDAMGNPTTYRNHALAWTRIRLLAAFGQNTFAYHASGIRYRKNNTTYTIDGSTILRESDGGKTLTYYYGMGGVIGFAYNGTDYYYRKNLRGDVIEISAELE